MSDTENMQQRSEVSSVFAVPLSQARVPHAEALNAELKSLLLERERDPRYLNKNRR